MLPDFSLAISSFNSSTISCWMTTSDGMLACCTTARSFSSMLKFWDALTGMDCSASSAYYRMMFDFHLPRKATWLMLHPFLIYCRAPDLLVECPEMPFPNSVLHALSTKAFIFIKGVFIFIKGSLKNFVSSKCPVRDHALSTIIVWKFVSLGKRPLREHVLSSLYFWKVYVSGKNIPAENMLTWPILFDKKWSLGENNPSLFKNRKYVPASIQINHHIFICPKRICSD